MLLQLRSTAGNDRGPQYIDQALVAIHQANSRRLPIVLELASKDQLAGLYCRYPTRLRAIVESQLAAAYPFATIERLSDDALDPPPGFINWSSTLRLRPQLFPLTRYTQFDDPITRSNTDPISGLLAAVAPGSRDATQMRVQLFLTPARGSPLRRAKRALDVLQRPYFRGRHLFTQIYANWAMSSRFAARILARLAGIAVSRGPRDTEALPAGRAHDRESDLSAAADKFGRHLFEVTIRIIVSGPVGAERKARARIREAVGAFAQFTTPQMSTFKASRMRKGIKRRTACSLLSTEELASVWHAPVHTVRAPKMDRSDSRPLEPPVRLPAASGNAATLGQVDHRTDRRRFAIQTEDRFRHLALIARTGQGKTTLMQTMAISDMLAGRGLAVLDPHGDLIEDLLRVVPKRRTNDVILLDPADRSHAVAYNPLACHDADQRPLVASAIVSSVKKVFGLTEADAPRMLYILRNAALALLESPGSTLVSLHRLLSDANFRKQVIGRVTDPMVRTFWLQEFATWPQRMQAEAVSPIQNKIGQLLTPQLRRVLAQPKSTIDLRQIMDTGKILFINTSQGRIGHDASSLLGAFLLTGMEIAAQSRADIPAEQRKPFFLYVDEVGSFATDSLATGLSELRKFCVGCTLACQFLAQLDERTRSALIGNCGSLGVLNVGSEDAEQLARELGGDVTPEDLLSLPRFHGYLRLLVDNTPSRAFTFQTIDNRQQSVPDRSAIVREVSRRRYARPTAEVTEDIHKRLALA